MPGKKWNRYRRQQHPKKRKLYVSHAPSRLFRQELCPGSAKLEAVAPEEPDSEAAIEGRLLHRLVWDKGERLRMDLTAEQLDLLRHCDNFLDSFGVPFHEWHHEVQLEMVRNWRKLTWGYADGILEAEDYLECVDFKFGRSPQEPAEASLQVASYCSMAMEKYRKPRARGWIFAPRVSLDPSDFTYTDPQGIVDHVEGIVDRADAWEIVLVPGDVQCHFCKARPFCPALAYAGQDLDTRVSLREDMPEVLPITQANAWEYWEKARAVEAATKYVKDQVRRMVEGAGGSLPGLVMKDRRGRAYIDNPAEALAELGPLMTPAELFRYCEVDVGAFRRAVVHRILDAGKVKTKAQAERIFDALVSLKRHRSYGVIHRK